MCSLVIIQPFQTRLFLSHLFEEAHYSFPVSHLPISFAGLDPVFIHVLPIKIGAFALKTPRDDVGFPCFPFFFSFFRLSQAR